MDFTKANNLTGIVAFLDFEKAFDTVNWEVIQDTLKIFGFGEMFRKWTKALYKGSQACVTNNGFSSPFFNLERGVRQGCPLSAYLFIMVVELLANKIRNTKGIKGIKIGQNEIKIIQMADDTTIFVEDNESLKKVLNIIAIFQMFAGLKLNKEKTEAMWLGKWRNSEDTPMGLKWVKEIHSLGIFFSYNTDYVVQKNFSDRTKAFKRILDLWSQRNLSLIGKIAILKSLAFSMITYQCCSLNVPDTFIETINKYAFGFLWNNKPDKIKRKTIISDYSNGGLRMLNLHSFISAQKVIWVKRLNSPRKASWKAYPTYVMKALMGMDAFRTHIDTKKNVNNVAPFYWTIFKNWNSIYDINKTLLDPFGIRRQRIWLNKYIKINKQEIWWKNWSEKGILIIHDIIDENGNFLSINNLEQRHDFKCNFLQYNSLKDAIPKEWRNNVKTIMIHREVISSDESIYVKINKQTTPLHKINNKLIYWKLIEEIRISPITKNKWIDELNLNKRPIPCG
jgi:hypothetical protein